MPDDFNLNNQNNQNAGSSPATPMDGLSSSPGKSPLEEASKDADSVQPTVPPEENAESSNQTPASSDLPGTTLPDLDQPKTEETPQAPLTPEPAPEPPAEPAAEVPSSQPSPESNVPMSSPEPPAPEPPSPEPSAPEPAQPEPPAMPELAMPDPTPASSSEQTPPANEPSPIDKPADQVEPGEPAPAPDTDEFLKNILANSEDTKPEEKPETPAATSEAPMPSSDNQPSVPSLGAPLSETSTPPTPESPAASADSLNSPAPTSGGFGGTTPPSVDSLGAPTPSPEQPNNVSNDIVGAMQKNAPEGGSKTKLIILVIVALIIIIGGYLAYTKLLNPTTPTSTTSESTLTASVTPVNISNDQVRKQDLKTIQQALLNLYAAENKYPVSNETIFLSGTTNVVAKALTNNLATIPVDPDPQKNYGYKSDGKTFTLTAVLDDTSDPDGVLENGLYLMKVTPTTVIKVSNTTIDGPADPTGGAGEITGALPSVTN